MGRVGVNYFDQLQLLLQLPMGKYNYNYRRLGKISYNYFHSITITVRKKVQLQFNYTKIVDDINTSKNTEMYLEFLLSRNKHTHKTFTNKIS